MTYEILKFLHITGIILIVGSVTTSAFWKVMADRTRDVQIMAHAQYNVVVADFLFTMVGIVLTISGGYGMAYVADVDLLRYDWLGASQLLFLVSGAIWLVVLMPIQVRQLRSARSAASSAHATASFLERYRRSSRTWLVWGIIATVPLVAALYLMVAKPDMPQIAGPFPVSTPLPVVAR